MDIYAKNVWIGNRQLVKGQIINLIDFKIYKYIINNFIFPLPGCVSVGVLKFRAISPIGYIYKYLPLIEAISSAPNTSHIACHLRIPTIVD